MTEISLERAAGWNAQKYSNVIVTDSLFALLMHRVGKPVALIPGTAFCMSRSVLCSSSSESCELFSVTPSFTCDFI